MRQTLRTLVLATLVAGLVGGVAATSLAAPTSDGPVDPYDQYIVKFKSGSNRSAALKAVGEKHGIVLSEVRSLAVGGQVIRVNKRGHGILKALMARGDVEYVEPDARMEAMAVPTDPRYAEQWHYNEATAGMNLPWGVDEGSGVTVAVIDTGRTAHSDLDANTVAGYDFISTSADARDGNGRDANPQDEGDWNATDGECGATSKAKNSSWHGTHVAGTIAALNNSTGVAGVATKAKIQHVRVLGKCGGSLSDIADAITWASGGTVSGIPANATPAKVINMSLGGAGSCGTTYQNAINGAVSRGTSIVVSAGNSNADTSGFRPASCNNVIAVAATDRNGDRAFYSNYGATVDISAPGGEVRLESDPPGSITTPENGVLSTMNAGATTPGAESYKAYMGTSMAAPHIAGLAALMVGKKSTLTPAQVESTLKSSARALAGTCTGGCGAGLADATAALNALNATWKNPGFESGNVDWTASSGVIDNSTNYAARTGSWKAWLNGYGSAHTDSISQSVSIPASASSATLKFWLRIDSAETTTTTVYDTLKVQVGTTTLVTYSNLNETSSYVEKVIDLSAYKGMTVTIKFLGVENSSRQTSFLVDDTSVLVS